MRGTRAEAGHRTTVASVAVAPNGAAQLRTQGLHAPSLVIAAMATAVLVNVVEYPTIDRDTSTQYHGVSVKGGHDLVSLVAGHFESTQDRFLLHVQVREFAPGAELELPPTRDRALERFRGLAMTGPVRVAEEAPVLTPELQVQLDAATVATGVDELIGPYAVAVLDGPVERLVVVPGNDMAYVADARLLSAQEG